MDRAQRVDNSATEAFPTIVVDGPSSPPASDRPASSPSPNPAPNPAPNPRDTIVVQPQSLPRQGSIRLRRLPSASAIRSGDQHSTGSGHSDDEDTGSTGRRRSRSEPQRPQHLGDDLPRPNRMDTLPEEALNPQPGQAGVAHSNTVTGVTGRLRSVSSAARSRLNRQSNNSLAAAEQPGHEYDAQIVDLLDVVDPEVSTLTTLTNVQNSLFVPDLGRWLNRRPTYELTRRPTELLEQDTPVLLQTPTRYMTAQEKERRQLDADLEEAAEQMVSKRHTRRGRSDSITSEMTDSHYAVLPHGASLEGWSEADKQELNDHVRHFLHSRRSKFKRRMRAFGKYVSKPLGFLVTLYAVLITLFGLAWVLFLIGWINVGGRQSYLINVIDNVLVALFAVMGDGLAPFRAVDTYHMCFIAHYHHLTWRLRREQAMPKLQDHNDLPQQIPQGTNDLEAAATGSKELSMLSPLQQKRLEHHQAKFAKSHSFYKPHETYTHHAFPLRLLVAVVCLLDCHSLFQIALGTCTWAISYHVRPQALTATILCCSICCNISAGIVITVGDRKTRKKDVIKKMFMQELTEEAIQKVKKRKTLQKERSLRDGLEEGEDVDALTHSQVALSESK